MNDPSLHQPPLPVMPNPFDNGADEEPEEIDNEGDALLGDRQPDDG